MNRRILLIDADHDFYGRLSDLLGRYRLDILVRPDPDEAIADGAIDPPAAILLAVDLPDKQGFKTFQTIKKGPLAKIPIVMVTKTVSTSDMTKHRGLKTHADDYVDKRTLSDDELLGRLDNLIELGEPVSAGDSLDIPMDVEDLRVGNDDMVLEETLGEEGPFSDNNTVAGRHEAVDQMVAAETDAAFDALLGFGDEPAAPSVSEQLRREKATTPPPFDEPADAPDHEMVPAGDAVPDPVPEPVPEPIAEPIPEPVEDLAVADPDMAADDARTTIAPPIAEPERPESLDSRFDDFDSSSREAPIQQAPVEAVAVADADAPFDNLESSPAIMLDASDVQLLDEDLVQLDEELEDSGGVPEAVPHANLVRQDLEEAAPSLDLDAVADAVPDAVPEPAPEAAYDPAPTDEPAPEPDPAEAPLAAVADEPAPEPPPVEVEAPVEPPVERRSRPTQQPFDLGLDAIAADAENEQSGVYDRRSLRKISELERQLAQLKSELDKARASAAEGGAARGSREREFFNLREQLGAKDAELRRATGDLDGKTRELADLEDRLRQVQAIRLELEAKSSDLEQRVAADAAKAKALAEKERVLGAQLASSQQDLEARAQALAASEAARAQLERDLASERATRAASTSEAELALRVEREQMIARHQGELSQLRVEHAGALAVALEKLRQELAAAQASALEGARAEHEAALEVARKQGAAAVEAARAEAMMEAEQAAARATAQHAAALERQAADHAAVLGKQADEHAAALARATAERDEALARAVSEQAGAIQRLTGDHAAEVSRLTAELAEQAGQHAAALAAREAELLGQRQDEAIAHTAALAELKGELDRQAAAAKKELDDVLALHEQAKARLLDDQQQAAAAQTTAHQDELERLAAEKQAALDEVAKARADHAKALADAVAAHAAELAQAKELADREISELKSVAVQAKRAVEEATVRHQAEREALEQQHAATLAEHTAQHERALAVANGETIRVKAVADAEHSRALAAKDAEIEAARKAATAEHAKQTKELSTERDELQRGLSAARDTIKRSEGELAAAVQTIADRNAELRTHAAAIAERDQRIAELRKEIEGLETENASYQDQVLRAYQKIKQDEAKVARARKAAAIALTVLDDDPKPKADA